MLVVEVAVQLTDDSQAVLQWGFPGVRLLQVFHHKAPGHRGAAGHDKPVVLSNGIDDVVESSPQHLAGRGQNAPGLELCGQNGHAPGLSKPFRRGHAAA